MTEPMAWYYAGSRVEPESVALDCDLLESEKANCIPLYTALAQSKEWVGLTKGERNQTWTQDHWTAYERGIAAAEREACAQEAEAEASIEGIAQRIAATIRARGNK